MKTYIALKVFIAQKVWMLRYFFVLAILCLAACEQGGTVEGKIADARERNDGPAIWVAKDVDSTLYLYGTVHLLSADINWQRDDMREALDSSGTVFFEVPTDDAAQLEANVLTSILGLYKSGNRLSDTLDSYQLKLLEAVSHNGDLSLPMLDSMKPWLAAEFLTVAAAAEAGLSPEISADAALKNRAARRQKNIIYLDTIESQIRASADQPDFVQLTVLTEALAQYSTMGNDMRRVALAWSTGQTNFLEDELIGEFKRRSPDYYQTLFVDRNITWTQEFDKFLQGSGTGFAAVGIGHLLGEESVIRRLRDEGYTVSRYYAFQGENVIKTIDLNQ